MPLENPFKQFLTSFIPKIAAKGRQLNKAVWLLETTGSVDALDLKSELDTEFRLLFSDPATYEKLLRWEQKGIVSAKDTLLKRELSHLIRLFKQNALPSSLVAEIARKEAEVAHAYANYRPTLEGKVLSENDIREILKKERDPFLRKRVWNASKSIGEVLAPSILDLVHLRNRAATHLGYSDYFAMQLELQEVDEKWLFPFLDELALRSDATYATLLDDLALKQSEKLGVAKEELGPWAWSDPFCQEDPLATHDLDTLVKGADLLEISTSFFQRMGFDVAPVLKKSDMFERPAKNQHAFCLNIDRGNDVRTLNNVNATIKWFETTLHELGHAIYELGYNRNLSWLLREPPHMITTEAMALIAGRQAYHAETFNDFFPSHDRKLAQKGEESLKRRQLIFSRWVLVMTHFERELYRQPHQDLNALWWELVAKYQKISPPLEREGKSDWAAKYHIGLAPVYYYSYLLGEVFASAIEEALLQVAGERRLTSKKVGDFLSQKLFSPGNSLPWFELVRHVTGHPLSTKPWLSQFASS